jgi:hypothetical protein
VPDNCFTFPVFVLASRPRDRCVSRAALGLATRRVPSRRCCADPRTQSRLRTQESRRGDDTRVARRHRRELKGLLRKSSDARCSGPAYPQIAQGPKIGATDQLIHMSGQGPADQSIQRLGGVPPICPTRLAPHIGGSVEARTLVSDALDDVLASCWNCCPCEGAFRWHVEHSQGPSRQ